MSDTDTYRLKYLITGTGRCGTKSVGTVFCYAGLPCGHEHYFKWGGGMPDLDDGRFVAESSWLAAPFLDQLPSDITIIHVVRDPIDTIQSLHKLNIWGNIGHAGYNLFVRRKLPSMDNYESLVDKTFHFYVEWNKMIEPYAHIFHHIEDGPEVLFEKLGLPTDNLWWGATNHGGWPRTTIEEMDVDQELKRQFCEMALRYGYEGDYYYTG